MARKKPSPLDDAIQKMSRDLVWTQIPDDDPRIVAHNKLSSLIEDTKTAISRAIMNWAILNADEASILSVRLLMDEVRDMVSDAISDAADVQGAFVHERTQSKQRSARPRAKTSGKDPKDGPRDSRGRLIGKRAARFKQKKRGRKVPDAARAR